jgi:N6-L-threonylcarbamoyladenine synthase
MLGLEFPGGPAIDRLARLGDPTAIAFPRPRQRTPDLGFSFSGLKTSLLYKLRDMNAQQRLDRAADLAAGYQEAIVQVLVTKALAALRQEGLSALAVVGGVSANSRLRALLTERAAQAGIRLALPPMRYCTDNAAMIARVGRHMLLTERHPLENARSFDIQPTFQVASTERPALRKESTHS